MRTRRVFCFSDMSDFLSTPAKSLTYLTYMSLTEDRTVSSVSGGRFLTQLLSFPYFPTYIPACKAIFPISSQKNRHFKRNISSIFDFGPTTFSWSSSFIALHNLTTALLCNVFLDISQQIRTFSKPKPAPWMPNSRRPARW